MLEADGRHDFIIQVSGLINSLRGLLGSVKHKPSTRPNRPTVFIKRSSSCLYFDPHLVVILITCEQITESKHDFGAGRTLTSLLKTDKISYKLLKCQSSAPTCIKKSVYRSTALLHLMDFLL